MLAAFILLGEALVILTRRPRIFRPVLGWIVALLVIANVAVDMVRDSLATGDPTGLVWGLGLVICAAVVWIVLEWLGPLGYWEVHNAAPREVRSALGRVLAARGLRSDDRGDRVIVPSAGVGGLEMRVLPWLGSSTLQMRAMDGAERRAAERALFPSLRAELARLPGPSIPWTGIFDLALAAALLAIAAVAARY